MRTFLNINENWTFLKEMSKAPVDMSETAEVINLPHTWNAKDGQDGGIMNLVSGLSVLRFTSMLGMRNVYFTKEELLKLNKQLNKISKKYIDSDITS